MRHITLLLLLSFSFQISAWSQKCRYEKNEVDALTELEVKLTQPAMLLRINNAPVYVKAQSIGDNKYLKLIHQVYGDFVLQEDREVSFRLSNNEELTLYPRAMPKDSVGSDYMDYTTLLVYKLSELQFEVLSSTPVRGFKYIKSTGWVEEPIKESKQETIMQLMRCIE